MSAILIDGLTEFGALISKELNARSTVLLKECTFVPTV
jgi:hypothetical protein